MQKNKTIFKHIYVASSLIAIMALSTVFYSRAANSIAAGAKKQQYQSKIRYISPSAHIDSSYLVPVDKWKNKKFIALAKLKFFRKFGYELYLSKELASSVAPLDTALETDKHHVRYEALCGKTLLVTDIVPADNEFLVTFTENRSNATYYAKTHKQAIEGLAYADDINTAAKQWVGKTVFSRRRSIDIYDSATGSFSNIKVAIQEPLKVTCVVWGTTPMPPKPLWLCVKTANNESGIIPIAQSFANVMPEKMTSNAPWQEDVFDIDPTKTYSWDSLTWKAINTHSIVSGMSKEQVLVSWGQPQRIAMGAIKAACAEQWLYGSQFLCFDHDSVTSIGGL